MTPYQLYLVIKDYNEKKKQEQKDKLFEIYVTSAWTSRWVWAKKIPSYDEITRKIESKEESKEAMTDEQMLAVVTQLNAMLGGEVREVGKE